MRSSYSFPFSVLMSIFCLLLIHNSGCSHSPPIQDGIDVLSLKQSKIEISYELRHSHRRFLAEQTESQIIGQTYLDQQIVTQSVIDPMGYRELFKKASEFIEKSQNTANQNEFPCRGPFTINLRKNSEFKTLKGCRTQDEGTLSRLIKEAELLLNKRK